MRKLEYKIVCCGFETGIYLTLYKQLDEAIDIDYPPFNVNFYNWQQHLGWYRCPSIRIVSKYWTEAAQ